MSISIARPARTLVLGLLVLGALALGPVTQADASWTNLGFKTVGPCTTWAGLDRSGNYVRAGGQVACNGIYSQISGHLYLKKNGVIIKDQPFVRWWVSGTGWFYSTYAYACGAGLQAVLVLGSPASGYVTSSTPVRYC